MIAGAIGARDLRLVPPAVLAWLGSGLAIGVRDAGPALPIVAVGVWMAASGVLVVALSELPEDDEK